MLLSFIIKYFLILILYNYCDEAMCAHSSIEYFGLLYNFADAIIFLIIISNYLCTTT